MNRFTRKKRKNDSRGFWGICIVFFLCLLGFILCMNIISKGNEHNRLTTLEEAINRDITACYAEEGSYPESIRAIRERYGLVYDTEEFIVNYELRGSNIRPEVTVIRREAE